MNNIDIRKIQFNLRRECKNSIYYLTGNPMEIVDVRDLPVSKTTIKIDEGWIQIFDTGKRVSIDTVEWETWNGCVFVDIDAKNKWGKDEEAKHKVEILTPKIHKYLESCSDNYLLTQISNSGSSWHFLFYFDVEKNKDNFKRSVIRANDIVKNLFVNNGMEDVILTKDVMDYCNKRYVQPLYLSHHEFYLSKHIDDEYFGWCEIDDIDISVLDEKIHESSDFDLSGNLLVSNFKWGKSTATKRIYHHNERMMLFWSCMAISKSVDEALTLYENRIMPYFMNYDAHTHKDMLWAAKQAASQYKREKTTIERLKPFGLSFDRIFTPYRIETYNPDVVITLKDNERLGDIDIPFKYDKINHLFAGCGVGKTFMGRSIGEGKEYTDDVDFLMNYFDYKKKRVCFICPLNSISKNSFENKKDWQIVDGEHPNESINDDMNICTSWESFYNHRMYEWNFEYIIIDEIHMLYNYDYRINSIANIKSVVNKSNAIKIFMSGTPSYEIEEFDCFKIKIEKDDIKVPTDIVFYNDDYKGFIFNDIKEWINKEESNAAVIFYDRHNYSHAVTYEVMFGEHRFEMFNKNNKETTEFILTNETLRKQVTAFSVYGQAGINIVLKDREGKYTSNFKKVRIYVLNDEGMNIVQYANRIRNKELVDKLIIPLKKSNVSNDIVKLSGDVDFIEARRKVEVLKEDKKMKSYLDKDGNEFRRLFRNKYGLDSDCISWDYMELMDDRYKCWKLIQNVKEYEKQTQVIYNRLVDGHFVVNIVEIDEDVKFDFDTKLRSNVFAGAIARFNPDCFKLSHDKSTIYFIPDDNINKYLTGNLTDIIKNIVNYIYELNGNDFERTIETFMTKIIHGTINKNSTIKKKNFEDYYKVYKYAVNWDKYKDNVFISLMLDERWDDLSIASVYSRATWSDLPEQDWKFIVNENYENLKSIRKSILNNKELFLQLIQDKECYNEYKFVNDDILNMISCYLASIHTRGSKKDKNKEKNTKQITVKGIKFNSVQDAAKYFDVSRMTINRWINQ